MLGLYIHVPFCQSICSYCNFNRGLFDAALKARYVEAVIREIRDAGDGRDADTIFFGGGTPSLLEPAEVAQILEACRSSYRVSPEVEVTLEANPETVNVATLTGFARAGVNRLSFGAQSFDDGELVRLGRAHQAAAIGRAVADARTAGFVNVSLDLMFWLPGQSRRSWLDSLQRAMSLAPEHLSLYLLELYPNAPLREAMARAGGGGPGGPVGEWDQTADDEAADMYLEAIERLSAAGYAQYEISNVAQPGRQSRHNLKYWSSGNWRGFGCGAHSTVDGRRWHNVAGTHEYVDRVSTGRRVAVQEQTLDTDLRVAEALFTGLRLTVGLIVAHSRRDSVLTRGRPTVTNYATLSMPASSGSTETVSA